MPEREELAVLIEALEVGDFETLKAEAERLQQEQDSYVTFANRILELAEEYQQEAIEKLLNSEG